MARLGSLGGIANGIRAGVLFPAGTNLRKYLRRDRSDNYREIFYDSDVF